MGDRRKRRSWSDEEKRSICRQTLASGVSVSQVARRYEMNANQIFNWLKDDRFAPPEEENQHREDGCDFLSVEIGEDEPTAARSDITPAPLAAGAALSARRVDITLSDGRRILVEGVTSLPAVLGLIKGMMA